MGRHLFTKLCELWLTSSLRVGVLSSSTDITSFCRHQGQNRSTGSLLCTKCAVLLCVVLCICRQHPCCCCRVCITPSHNNLSLFSPDRPTTPRQPDQAGWPSHAPLAGSAAGQVCCVQTPAHAVCMDTQTHTEARREQENICCWLWAGGVSNNNTSRHSIGRAVVHTGPALATSPSPFPCPPPTCPLPPGPGP